MWVDRLGVGECLVGVGEMLECRDLVDEMRVVYAGLDAVGLEVGDKGLSVLTSNNVEMVGVILVLAGVWKSYLGYALEVLVVDGGFVYSFLDLVVEILKFNSEEGGLEFVETTDSADGLTLVSGSFAVLSEASEYLSLFGVIGEDNAAITECAEVFGGIETEDAEFTV